MAASLNFVSMQCWPQEETFEGITTSGGHNKLCLRTRNTRGILRLPSSLSTKVMIIDNDDDNNDGCDGPCDADSDNDHDDNDHDHHDHDDHDAGMTTEQCRTSVNTTTVLLRMPYVSQRWPRKRFHL